MPSNEGTPPGTRDTRQGNRPCAGVDALVDAIRGLSAGRVIELSIMRRAARQVLSATHANRAANDNRR